MAHASSTLERDAGRLLMVGVRGFSPDDPALRADLDACRAARCRAVVLFDVDMPTFSAAATRSLAREEAILASPRNILDPAQARRLCAHLRGALGDDTIVAVDQEGGEVARLHPRRGFPCALSAEAFAALPADRRHEEAMALASLVASHGFTLNFAPCVDLALNPASPIIAGKRRAFGADAPTVTECASQVLDAHAERRVLACLKHFPGHGSSAADSHLGFADISTSWREAPELAPYAALLRSRAGFAQPWVMTGHLFHARIDADHPASLSRAHTTGLLRERLGFGGVVVTDSLDMRAVTDRYGPDEALIRALNAGADILLDANNMPGPSRLCPAPAMQETILRAAGDGRIEGGAGRIAVSARRIESSLASLGVRA